MLQHRLAPSLGALARSKSKSGKRTGIFLRVVGNEIQTLRMPSDSTDIPSKGVNWDTWCELGQNLVNRHRCDCR